MNYYYRKLPVYSYIYKHLSPETRKKIAAYKPSEPPTADLRKSLTYDLNVMLRGRSIYNEQVFSSIKLSDDVKKMIKKKNSKQNEVMMLNRKLLEEALPDDLGKSANYGIFAAWVAAAGQIFFTLSLGMGAIACYASYCKKDDDIVTSGVTTALTNECAEVICGGSIAIPLAVAFFGVAVTREIAQSAGLGFGFVTMPLLFAKIPYGNLFGGIWFILLFFAGITSSIAMSQIVVAFFEEIIGLKREKSVLLAMGIIFMLAQLAIFGIGKGAMDEMDTIAGTLGLTVFSLILVVIWNHVFGIEKAWAELTRGSKIKLWVAFKWITAYVAPIYLLVIIIGWAVQDGWKWFLMQGVKESDKPFILITRGILLLIFIILAWFSTHNMHKTELKEEAGGEEA